MRAGDLGEAAPVEVEEAHRVLAEDEPQLVLRHAGERRSQPLPRVRPGALRVRIVAPERELMDADLVAHRDFALVGERHAHEEVLCQYSLGFFFAGMSARLRSNTSSR